MVTFQGHFDAGEESSKFIMEPLISFYRGCLKKDQTGHDGLGKGSKNVIFTTKLVPPPLTLGTFKT